MNIKAIPFNSVVGYDPETGRPTYDRPSTAEDMRKFIRALVTDGVYLKESNNLYVQANGTGARVLKGLFSIQGVIGWIEDDLNITLPPADTKSKMYDFIILRLDNNMEKRNVEIVTRRSSAYTVALERTQEVWELQLARIGRPSNSTTVLQSEITDTRGDKNVCGWITGVVDQVDTSFIFTQFDEWLRETKEKWAAWWDGQQGGVQGYMLQGDYDPGLTGAVNDTRKVGGIDASRITTVTNDIENAKKPYPTLTAKITADDNRLTGVINVFNALRATNGRIGVDDGLIFPSLVTVSAGSWIDFNGYRIDDAYLTKGLIRFSGIYVYLKPGYIYEFEYIPFISGAVTTVAALDMRTWKAAGNGVLAQGYDGTSTSATANSQFSNRVGKTRVDCREATSETAICFSHKGAGSGTYTTGNINIITNIYKEVPFSSFPS